MIDGFGDPYIENYIVFLNELRRAKRDALNFLPSGSCHTDCLRHAVTLTLRYSKEHAQQARKKNFVSR
jgi:hypothetical protein